MHSPAVTTKTSPLDTHLHLTCENVEELIFSRVDMGWWFVALSHLKDNEIEGTAVVCRPRHLANEITQVPTRIA